MFSLSSGRHEATPRSRTVRTSTAHVEGFWPFGRDAKGVKIVSSSPAIPTADDSDVLTGKIDDNPHFIFSVYPDPVMVPIKTSVFARGLGRVAC